MGPGRRRCRESAGPTGTRAGERCATDAGRCAGRAGAQCFTRPLHPRPCTSNCRHRPRRARGNSALNAYEPAHRFPLRAHAASLREPSHA